MLPPYKRESLWTSLFFLCLFITSATSFATEKQNHSLQSNFRKAPYLIFNGSNSEMTLLWQLFGSMTTTIQWGTDSLYSGGSSQTSEHGTSHQHRFTLTNLNPQTVYYYRVIAGSDTSAGAFRSAPDSAATRLKFMAYGDTRSHPENHNRVAQDLLATAKQDSGFFSLIIASGDLVKHGDNEENWDSQFFNPSYTYIKKLLASFPYQSCRGNHEESGLLFKKYFPYPFVGGRYFAFDYGPALFVIVDQYIDYSPGSAQLLWIEQQLAVSTKKWKFIVLHEPGWSAGAHENSIPVQYFIQPLCVQYGVQVVFGGHNHYYARALVNGVQHITTGGGGAGLYQPDSTYPFIVATAKKHHFCKIQIAEDTLKFTAVDTTGALLDSFTMIVSPTPVANVYPALPGGNHLLNAYPNPFNPSTKISYNLNQDERVELVVFNLLGQRVKILEQGNRAAGFHQVIWNGEDESGNRAASGIYICCLRAGGHSSARRLLLIR